MKVAFNGRRGEYVRFDPPFLFDLEGYGDRELISGYRRF